MRIIRFLLKKSAYLAFIFGALFLSVSYLSVFMPECDFSDYLEDSDFNDCPLTAPDKALEISGFVLFIAGFILIIYALFRVQAAISGRLQSRRRENIAPRILRQYFSVVATIIVVALAAIAFVYPHPYLENALANSMVSDGEVVIEEDSSELDLNDVLEADEFQEQ